MSTVISGELVDNSNLEHLVLKCQCQSRLTEAVIDEKPGRTEARFLTGK